MHPFSCATLQPTCLPVIRIYESIDEPIVTIMLNETVIQVLMIQLKDIVSLNNMGLFSG